MFTLKPILTTAIVIGSVLSQQSVMAYPQASKTVELDYIKASFGNLYGTVTPEVANYLEEQYNMQSPSTELMLSGGYQICDGIKLANNEGISSQNLIEQEISNISQVSNGILEQQGVSLTEEQIIMIYNTAKNNLCPELD